MDGFKKTEPYPSNGRIRERFKIVIAIIESSAKPQRINFNRRPVHVVATFYIHENNILSKKKNRRRYKPFSTGLHSLPTNVDEGPIVDLFDRFPVPVLCRTRTTPRRLTRPTHRSVSGTARTTVGSIRKPPFTRSNLRINCPVKSFIYTAFLYRSNIIISSRREDGKRVFESQPEVHASDKIRYRYVFGNRPQEDYYQRCVLSRTTRNNLSEPISKLHNNTTEMKFHV